MLYTVIDTKIIIIVFMSMSAAWVSSASQSRSPRCIDREGAYMFPDRNILSIIEDQSSQNARIDVLFNRTKHTILEVFFAEKWKDVSTGVGTVSKVGRQGVRGSAALPRRGLGQSPIIQSGDLGAFWAPSGVWGEFSVVNDICMQFEYGKWGPT
jgi:hypothetical protein